MGKKKTHMSEFVGTVGYFSHPVAPTVPQIHAETRGAEQRRGGVGLGGEEYY